MRLLKFSMLLLFMFLFAGITQAQLMFGVQGGIGGSAFEDQKEAASSVPIAVFAGTNALPLFDVGVEYNMLVVPFKFEGEVLTQKVETEYTQSYYGAFIRWYVLPLPVIEPYIRAGAAYYTGKATIKVAGESEEFNFKNTLGFNIGAGVKTMTGLYGEFIFHMLSRELDTDTVDPETANKAAYNNWMIMVGYQFEL